MADIELQVAQRGRSEPRVQVGQTTTEVTNHRLKAVALDNGL
jgi:hypothetical protein